MPDYRRILITGAAGSIGGRLRRGLTHLAKRIRLLDARDMGAAAEQEEVVRCDLADRAAALEATRDCDAILHFAGHPRELSFEEVVADTLPAAYHVYEGARRNGCRRVVYASSIHAVGFHVNLNEAMPRGSDSVDWKRVQPRPEVSSSGHRPDQASRSDVSVQRQDQRTMRWYGYLSRHRASGARAVTMQPVSPVSGRPSLPGRSRPIPTTPGTLIEVAKQAARDGDPEAVARALRRSSARRTTPTS